MTLITAVGLLGGAALIVAFVCRGQVRFRSLALLSNILFVWYAAAEGLTLFLILNVVLVPINLTRLVWLIRGRRPTRETWKMDRDVHEKVRDIQAYSRYDSAGIEF